MSLFPSIVLLVAALVFQGMKAPRRAMACLILALGLILFVGSGLAAKLLLPATQLSDSLADVSWKAKNTIVVLGAGTMPPDRSVPETVPSFAYARLATGALAYADCRRHSHDCDLIVSGGDPQRNGEPEAVVYARVLRGLVPDAALRTEPRSLNTWQNAAYSTPMIAQDRQIVVVTSGTHLKRSLVFFNHFRPGCLGVASDHDKPLPGIGQTGYNVLLTDVLLHEQLGIAQYDLYRVLGLNIRAPLLTVKNKG